LEEAAAADAMLTHALTITSRLPLVALKLEPELTEQETGAFVASAKPVVIKWFPDIATAIPPELILLAVCWGIYGTRYLARAEQQAQSSKESASNRNIGNGEIHTS
jgi:hypothetical protein